MGARSRTSASGSAGPSGIAAGASSTDATPGSGMIVSSTTTPICVEAVVVEAGDLHEGSVHREGCGRYGLAQEERLVAPAAHPVVGAVVVPGLGHDPGAVADLDLEPGR